MIVTRRSFTVAVIAAATAPLASAAVATAGHQLFDSDSELNDEIPPDSPAEASEDSDADDYIARPKKQRQFVRSSSSAPVHLD